MQRVRDIELIFPIKGAPSAALMIIKADVLHKAGIINEAEKQWVNSKARAFLNDTTLKDAAVSHLTETSAAAFRRHVGGDISHGS
jgi:hypothetical protein